MSDAECVHEENSQENFGLRVGGIFVILITSFIGTLLPIVLKKKQWAPTAFFEFAKYFGSGVIIATAFIHLLAPAFENLSSPCLGGAWGDYDWTAAIAMMAVFFIFFVEFATYRVGAAKMARVNQEYQAGRALHVHAECQHAVPLDLTEHDPFSPGIIDKTTGDSETGSVTAEYDTTTSEGVAQLVAVAVLEFGIILHSVFIGLTLGSTSEFITLFIVIIFHQMFEGLGVGSRLSSLRLPPNLRWTPYAASFAYSVTTPIGMAIGIGISKTYNPMSASTMAWEGTLDAISAGILLYTGLVELLGHEILLNPKFLKASAGKCAYVFSCILCGAGLMALLAKWA